MSDSDYYKMAGAKICLGSAQFGFSYGISNSKGKLPSDEVQRIVEFAGLSGIRRLDTAALYGDAEIVLGNNILQDFRVTTKTLHLDHDIAGVVSGVERSLQRLGVAAIDTLLVHRAADLTSDRGPQLWAALEGLRDQGKVKHLGVSCYLEDEPLRLAKLFPIEVMQAPISVLDQRLERAGILDDLAERGIRVVARSVFLQGLALMAPGDLPMGLRHFEPVVANLDRLAMAQGVSRLDLCLGHVMSLTAVDHAVVGVTSQAELAALLGVLAKLPDSGLSCAAAAASDPALLNPSLWPRN